MFTYRSAPRAAFPSLGAAAVAATLFTASPATPQVPADAARPTHVPIEFVELLAISPFGGMEAGGARVLVGRLPEDLPEIVRSGSGRRVVGSMVYPLMSISALVAPGNRAALEREWGHRLSEAGWRSQQPPMESRGGFLAPATDDMIDLKQLCAPDNSAMLAISAAPRGADSVVVTMVRARGMMASACGAGAMRVGMQRQDLELPILTPPEGVTLGRSGTGSGGGEPNSYARARTGLPPTTLLEHYAAQMAAAGWVPGTAVVGDDVAAQTFSRSSQPGSRPANAVLTATRLSPGEVDLHLRVMRPGR
jgi:hypothetical protein